ncbi:hypothetical protein HUJ04_010564 [Dendroctonus ponderosae]|nr:hypothetical protein HUJ04_010564 [Dendroctonus ponderosae]
MMLFMSPFFAIFMYFLLISAYIYSLDLSGQELPSTVGHIDFRSGINRPNDLKWIELLAKSMLGVLIFTSMRRLLQERTLANQQAAENVAGSSSLTPEANISYNCITRNGNADGCHGDSFGPLAADYVYSQ